MSTRGLIIVKKNKKKTMIYNHSDSYPSSLMVEINQRLLVGDYKEFEEEILSGVFTNYYSGVITEIDYLFHEYIYVLDFDKQTWSAYKTQFTEQGNNPKKWDYSKGKLIPILLNIPFNKEIKVYEDEDLEEDKAIIVEEREEHNTYEIIKFKKNYYLFNLGRELIFKGKNKEETIREAVIKKL